MNTLNNYFDKIYCINLDKRKDRWQKCQEIFKKLNIEVERISAVEGHPKNIKVYHSILKKRAGLVGCHLSHLKCIKLAKENNFKNVLILEDDIEFDNAFISKFSKLVLPDDWKLLYLGGNNNVGNPILIEFSKHVYQTKNTMAAHSYAIDNTIYDELIDLLIKMDNPHELIYIDIQKKFKCYVTRPHLTWQRESFSDIMNGKRFYKKLKM